MRVSSTSENSIIWRATNPLAIPISLAENEAPIKDVTARLSTESWLAHDLRSALHMAFDVS